MAARLMWITWPAFLAACVLEMLVFALVDPSDLAWSGQALNWSRQAVYTSAFFAFWAVSLGACWLTTVLRMTPQEVNDACPYAPDQRPEGCPGR
ncbi:hypothetical protein HHL11_15820 [Ramlibacter sp. G-1-2-2]|uniref:Transmembrane protein n=1 Tax=Ramlibacter agri TaxID=2728837 RepID=A0A848H5W1_9BURK|nr:hypothetical protein [Ramlibacter agri]NML45222.1 hypothetical protein [Ramlibacter agri]